jgi:hypothetical protein
VAGAPAKVGTLLLGLWPVLAETEDGSGRLVVAGRSLAGAGQRIVRQDEPGRHPLRNRAFVGEAVAAAELAARWRGTAARLRLTRGGHTLCSARRVKAPDAPVAQW